MSVKIIATEDRYGVQVVAADNNGSGFFESAIKVYAALNQSCNSSQILALFLRAMVDYIVEEESEWIAGDKVECERQDRTIKACVVAMSAFGENIFLERAIKKANAFINNSLDEEGL